jgi:hypothetical protein
MERLTTAICLDALRRANAQLTNFFACFSGAPVVGTREEVEALLQVEHTLRSVARLLKQGVQRSSDPAVREELASYGTHLLRLRRELAIMQNSATGCQARLSVRQNHLHSAHAWFAASRATR